MISIFILIPFLWFYMIFSDTVNKSKLVLEKKSFIIINDLNIPTSKINMTFATKYKNIDKCIKFIFFLIKIKYQQRALLTLKIYSLYLRFSIPFQLKFYNAFFKCFCFLSLKSLWKILYTNLRSPLPPPPPYNLLSDKIGILHFNQV